MPTLNPTIPIEVETRKNVFISQSKTGLRTVVLKSGAVRFFTLNFNFRDQDEYLAQLADFDTYYPATAFTWTNADLGVSGYHVFMSELKATSVENPDVFTYAIDVRARDPLAPTNPGTTTFPYKPNFAYDITNTRKVLVSESVGFARVGKTTSNIARQFQYTFKNRSLAETLAAENFWAYHYPVTQISFHDDTFDEDMTFYLDSNFKWTVNGIDLIDYTFVFTEVLAAPTPPAASTPTAPTDLVATAVSSSQVNLTWTDNASSETGYSIERCSGSGCTSFVEVATVPHNSISYSNTGLTGGTLYRYRVRAFNAAGYSAYSNVAEDTTGAAGISITDDFNRADSTTTLGNATTGETWVNNVGVFRTLTSQANAFSLTGGKANSTIEAAQSDVAVELTINSIASDSTVIGIIFRYSDTSNYFTFVDRGSGDGTVTFNKVVAGVSTELYASVPAAEPYTLKVSGSGSTIKLYRNAVLIATITDTFNQTATQHGLYATGTSQMVDDFSIVTA